jgi:divalent metal cation (Fe/Co/Zn/Cd) transporter
MAILGFGVVAESVSLWGALREIAKVRGERSLWRWFRQSRQSELLVILAEDVAALAGLVLALAAIALAQATGDPRWDAAGSIAIGSVLVAVALMVAIEIKALLIGQSVAPEVVQAMRGHLAAEPEIAEVYSVLTQQLGNDVMVAVKARFHPLPSDRALIEAINRVEVRLREAFPAVRWMFFEPDLAD